MKLSHHFKRTVAESQDSFPQTTSTWVFEKRQIANTETPKIHIMNNIVLGHHRIFQFLCLKNFT